MWAAMHRGYWLVASVYLVLDAELTPFQLVMIGTVQSAVAVVCEIPAGVVADTISRKWSLVIAQVLMGSAIVVTGFVESFPALVATQALWGIAWCFASGADIAWITDELNDPSSVDRVLAASVRWVASGSAIGLVIFGGLASITSRATAIVVAGLSIVLLAAVETVRLPEYEFERVRSRRVRAAGQVFQRGVNIARRDRQILVVFAATFLVNGAAEGFGRLYADRLFAIGFPLEPDPMVWYLLLGMLVLATGAAAMYFVERRIELVSTARVAFAASCAVGGLGLVVVANGTSPGIASLGVALTGGAAFTVTQAVGSIWVNRRTTSEARATVHSMLAQMEYFGEIACGFGIALITRRSTVPTALMASGCLLALAVAVVWLGPSRRSATIPVNS
jgi:MFS family permease